MQVWCWISQLWREGGTQDILQLQNPVTERSCEPRKKLIEALGYLFFCFLSNNMISMIEPLRPNDRNWADCLCFSINDYTWYYAHSIEEEGIFQNCLEEKEGVY